MARLTTSQIVMLFQTGQVYKINRYLTAKDKRELRKAKISKEEIESSYSTIWQGVENARRERNIMKGIRFIQNTPTIQEFKEGLGTDIEAKRMFGLTLKKVFNIKELTSEEQRALPISTQRKMARFMRDYISGNLIHKLDQAIIGNFMGALESQGDSKLTKLVMYKLRQLTAQLNSDEIWALYTIDLPQANEFYKDKGRTRTPIHTAQSFVDEVNAVIDTKIEELKTGKIKVKNKEGKEEIINVPIRWKEGVDPYYYDLYEGGYKEMKEKHKRLRKTKSLMRLTEREIRDL